MSKTTTSKAVVTVVFSMLSLTTAFAANAPTSSTTDFGNIKMVSQPDAKHTRSSKGVLSFDDNNQQAVFTGKHGADLMVPYNDIRAIRLEQDVRRLQTPFTGRVQHHQYVTVQYGGPNSTPSYVVFDLNGRSYRQVVASFEAKSGKRADWKSE